MVDEPPGGAGTSAPPEPPPEPPPPEPPDPGDGDGDERVRRANAEAARYRTQLRETQAENERLKGASKSAEERAAERAAAAERERDAMRAELRRDRGRAKAAGVARNLGATDPDVVAKLAVIPDDAWNDDGEVSNDAVKKAVEAVLADHPGLARPGDADAGGGSRGRATPPSDMNRRIRAAAGRGR